jgi:hypothetical protein
LREESIKAFNESKENLTLTERKKFAERNVQLKTQINHSKEILEKMQ